MHPTITPGIDVALLCFWAFVLFFVCLIFYLRREDRREGYPLEDDLTGIVQSPGGAAHTAIPKTFRLPFGHGEVTVPRAEERGAPVAARRTEKFSGAPLVPTGNPLADGVGPAAWADRAKRPDVDMDGHARIVPLSTAGGFTLSPRDPDPRGMPVVGADGAVAGTVTDLWIDKADRLIRYLQLDSGVLAPMTMAKIDKRRRRIVVDALLASQFAGAPRIAGPATITLYEEDRVQAYFGGGYLYATPARQEPLL